eukprot:3138395-Amphidinium_carterae.1
MTSAERQVNGVANGTLAGDDQALSSQLFYMLVTGVKGSALDIVLNAGEREGMIAWAALHR